MFTNETSSNIVDTFVLCEPNMYITWPFLVFANIWDDDITHPSCNVVTSLHSRVGDDFSTSV